MARRVIVIGSGFAGMSAACFMARAGWDVTVLDQLDGPGGRAGQLKKDGFFFDKGPSWYWMPDVFERWFGQFGQSVSDHYTLTRLDPSYRIYEPERIIDVPAGVGPLRELFESFEPGAARALDTFLAQAAYKYKVGMQKLVFKPGRSFFEFIDRDILLGLLRLDVFQSMERHIHRHFRHPSLRRLLSFPVLFLGALPENTPALYSLMNYADMAGGTWYPRGGMYAVVEAMYRVALGLGVRFHFSQKVQQIMVERGRVSKVITDGGEWGADVVISGADYHFTETMLLAPEWRSYTESYWDSRVMAPSCLLYYVGLDRRLPGLRHHSLFFDTPFDRHAAEIYTSKTWPADPLFYLGAPSVSDDTVAPAGHENLFFLIPVAAGLEGDTDALRDRYFPMIAQRLEKVTGVSVTDAVVSKTSFSRRDFIHDYNAYKGNAYGLANTLLQTANLKPSCKSRKVSNLWYTGQLTVPGPGVPPSLISGEVVAGEVLKQFP